MKNLILIAVWIICLLNIFFFGDIVYNYLIGNTLSSLSGASTGNNQFVISVFMIVICIIIISIYTVVIRSIRN